MMDAQSVLIGALLLNDQLAPYSLPELSIEHFRPELQPAFAAVQGFWIKNGELDILQIVARYPNQKQPLMACVGACESECIRLTRDRVEEWTRIILEDSAKSHFQSLALRAVDAATGLSKLDENLHLVPGNYFVIGGRPSAGKTALSLQLAAGMAKSGKRVCYFSLETDPATLEARLIANQLYVPLSAVKNKTLSLRELDRLADMKHWPLYIRSAAGKGVAWLKAQALRMKADIIFVDYLQLIHERGGGDRYTAITEISIALHELAQTTGILVVALAQLNRNAARAEPSNADLRESGQIEQDADAILLLSADGDAYFSRLTKNKEGRVGNAGLEFDKTLQRFTCAAT